MAIPEITTEQTRWFRYRKSGLVNPFASPAEAAHHLVGIQSQIPISSYIALFHRLSAITLADLRNAHEQERKLIRMWGQRSTVHLYDANDWPLLHRWIRTHEIVASKLKQAGVEKEFEDLVRYLERRLIKGDRIKFKDVESFIGFEKILSAGEICLASMNLGAAVGWSISAAAIKRLVAEGLVCHGPDDGVESTFVHRLHWLPELVWLEDESSILSAGVHRYLGTYGPATLKEMATFFGTTASEVRQWTVPLEKDLIEISRAGTRCVARAGDLDDLGQKPPTASSWGVRLLHRFDPYVLGAVGIKDKVWLLDADHISRVWRPGGHIEAVILDGGRVIGCWRYKRKSKGLMFDLSTFKPMSKRVHREVIKNAESIAGFLEQEIFSIELS